MGNKEIEDKANKLEKAKNTEKLLNQNAGSSSKTSKDINKNSKSW